MVVEKLSIEGYEGWFITQMLEARGYGIIDSDASSIDSKKVDIDEDGKNNSVQITANIDIASGN